ncbi:MAG TPA: flagellar motor switch protein FliN [Treponemataceae bacterium]|nr:flagellar motor switch protein FliN [Treponemataceae bacterium]
MSDGAISQDEIDALLSGVDMGGLSSAGLSSSKQSSQKLNTETLLEFMTEKSEALKATLDAMTGASFSVGAPTVEQVTKEQVLRKIPEMAVGVTADFSEGLSGDHVFVLAPEFAQKIAGLVNKEEDPELSEMSLSVVSEIISQYVGSQITKLSQTGFFPGLANSPPEAVHVPKAMLRYPSGEFILVSHPVSGEGSVFTLWELIAKDASSQIITALGGNPIQAAPAQSPSMATMGQGMPAMDQMQAMPQMGMGQMAMPQMGMGQMAMPQMGGGASFNAPNVQSLQYPQLQTGVSSMEQGNIGLIMDVYMEMTVELGRTKKQIKEILGMGEGTIIELDKLAGEPVDILVNHKPIAKGEVVVIDENFGVRVTEILSPIERMSDLR